MRHAIWEKDDFFQFIEGPRIDMDPAVCDISAEEIPLCWNFDIGRLPTAGCVRDLRLEDGEITGEVIFFEDDWDSEKMKELGCRLGGYYVDVERNVVDPGKQERLTKCRLTAVSIISKYHSPAWTERNTSE